MIGGTRKNDTSTSIEAWALGASEARRIRSM
jgi:hypothetical protein